MEFGKQNSGFFSNSQSNVDCQFITCCTINQCGVIIPDSGTCSSVRCAASNCASGAYSASLGGFSNTASGIYSAIVGGRGNNTCTFADSFIIGSNLCATQACTTFVNCLSANNLTSGCSVCVTTNGVLVNTAPPTAPIIILGAGTCSTLRCNSSNAASACYSAALSGCANTASGIYSAILGGKSNNTCTFANSFIVGSNLCATQACTTFTNCLSANNLTTGCFVVVGNNKVLENSLIPTTSLSYGLYAQTALSTPIAATTVQKTLIGAGVGTLTVPANAFKVGDSFTAKLCGNLNNANNETIHIRVKSDGLVIADAGVFTLNLATGQHFELVIDFTVTQIGGIGVAQLFVNGQFSYNKNANTNIDGVNFALISNTFDTTVNNTLNITAEWGSANINNSIQTQNFVLTKVY